MKIDTATKLEAASILKALDGMPLHVYALRFGGLLVSDEHLIAFKAEYRVYLLSLIAA